MTSTIQNNDKLIIANNKVMFKRTRSLTSNASL